MLYFIGTPAFTPSYTPVEMFNMGIFGGSYFQIDTQLPEQFVTETNIELTHNKSFDKTKNCYGVECGSSLEWWTEKGLIHKDDPNGWVEKNR